MPEGDARKLRDRLVDGPIAHVVRDPRVIRAMREVPRHAFVPDYPLDLAYEDHPLSIGWDVTISQPSLVALMSEALDLHGGEHVLEIGTGSGYQAAVLCQLGAVVDSVEVVPELAARAARTLAEIGYGSVRVHTGDGWAGWRENAPYDRIVVTAAPDIMPEALVAQLHEDGMIVAPLGAQERDQRLERWRKKAGTLYKQDLGAVRFVPMVHGRAN